jgi:hypothetical protein
MTAPLAGGTPTLVDTYFAADPSGASTFPMFDGVPGLGGSGGITSYVPSPTWHGTNVGWARVVDSTSWEIVTAPDMKSGPVSVYMKCPGMTPREIAFLSDGTVMVAYRPAMGGPVDLTLFKTDSSQNCKKVHTYSNLSGSSNAVATSFTISPDETQVAFAEFDPATDDASLFSGAISVGFLYVAPVDGSQPATRLSNDATIYGPRWVGGGRLLAFNKLGSYVDAAASPPLSIAVISPEGGTPRIVEKSDGLTSVVTLSSSLSCNSAGRPVGAGLFSMLSIAIAARLAMRRRRRRDA